MSELKQYCDQHSNDMGHRQARVFMSYIIRTLLGKADDVRFYDENGICYRQAMFN